MLTISASSNCKAVRCKAAGLLLLTAFVAMTFASVAQAQIPQHGATVSKACLGPVRTCDTDEDCNTDGDACTLESCNLAIADTLYCEYEVGYNDDFNDTITVTSAWDIIDPAGSATRSPAAGNAEIIFVGGNTTCVVGGTLPCTIGPDLGGGAGSVTFVENLYEPTAGDPSPLEDQASAFVLDACNGDFDEQCNSTTESLVQFVGQTNLVSGCESDGEVTCDDGNACTTESCNSATGLCETTDTVTCDDGDACTTESCDTATGLCETTDTVTCDDGDACTTESCNSTSGECETTDTVTCDDLDACTTESCNSTSGECETTDTVTCDDLDACTTESCNSTSGECETTDTVTCDDLNDCTDDSCDSATGECVYVDNGTCGEEICRTPGFWGTHGGDEKAPKSVNVTQDVIDAAGGLDVCGTTITNTDLGSNQSAIEAICVAVKGDLELQLVRQLTAAALNCATAPCNTDHSELVADCNLTCADGSGTLTINECIDQLDCFNNGGTFDGESCTFPGACDSSEEACLTDDDCTEINDFCVPFETCHDRSLCPEDGTCWFEGGPASSPAKCNAARKNDTFVP